MRELGVDEVLTTTRAVRRRLDLTRPVDPELLRACLGLAVQAPSGGNDQRWHFVVVTDLGTRAAIADAFRRGAIAYAGRPKAPKEPSAVSQQRFTEAQKAARKRVMASAAYLFEHLHEVPVLVIPCIEGRFEDAAPVDRATAFGSVLPAVWSFMLAARARGLGTSWTTAHLMVEQEVAEIVGIPYHAVTQVALVPVAHTIGDDFAPGPRRPLDDVVHWDRW